MTEQCDQCRFFKLSALPDFDTKWMREYEISVVHTERITGKAATEAWDRLGKRYEELVEYYAKNPDKLDVGKCRWERDNQPVVKRTHFCRHFEKFT